MPRLTILMSVYSAAPYLAAALDSLLAQTFGDFTLLLMDDGSNDGSGAIADAYAARDPRVRVRHLPHDGLVAALNRGLDEIDTELIARADADDLCRPDRLARQVALLDARPEIGVCGSWVETFPHTEIWTLPATPDELAATALFMTPVHNPTALMRRDWLARAGMRYDAAFVHAEDYDFWERATRLTRLATIPAPLVRYRRHADQTSSRHRAAQDAASAAIRRRQVLALGLAPTDEELAVHEDVSCTRSAGSRARLEAGRRWIERLRAANRAAARYPEPAFTRMLATRWYRNCAEATLRGLPGLRTFFACSVARGPRAAGYAARLAAMRACTPAMARRVARAAQRLQAR
jgi:glycosyltransferase involved in cell wall biosynthesis